MTLVLSNLKSNKQVMKNKNTWVIHCEYTYWYTVINHFNSITSFLYQQIEVINSPFYLNVFSIAFFLLSQHQSLWLSFKNIFILYLTSSLIHFFIPLLFYTRYKVELVTTVNTKQTWSLLSWNLQCIRDRQYYKHIKNFNFYFNNAKY